MLLVTYLASIGISMLVFSSTRLIAWMPKARARNVISFKKKKGTGLPLKEGRGRQHAEGGKKWTSGMHHRQKWKREVLLSFLGDAAFLLLLWMSLFFPSSDGWCYVPPPLEKWCIPPPPPLGGAGSQKKTALAQRAQAWKHHYATDTGRKDAPRKRRGEKQHHPGSTTQHATRISPPLILRLCKAHDNCFPTSPLPFVQRLWVLCELFPSYMKPQRRPK